MSSELIQKTAEYVKSKLLHEPSGHDWYHVERVWGLARFLQSKEGGDLEVVELAALLHNLGDHTDYTFNVDKGPLILFGMMDILGIDERLKKRILLITQEMKYAGEETKPPSTLEGRIVQDANFLDSLGALGVARHLASGGYYGRTIYDPKIKVRQHLTRFAYEREKKKGTSINNFYERALRLVSFINTPTAKRIAEAKVVFTKQFIEHFIHEWKGEDIIALFPEAADMVRRSA